jgi:hypothetical protein
VLREDNRAVIGGNRAFYAPGPDFVMVPPPQAYFKPTVARISAWTFGSIKPGSGSGATTATLLGLAQARAGRDRSLQARPPQTLMPKVAMPFASGWRPKAKPTRLHAPRRKASVTLFDRR